MPLGILPMLSDFDYVLNALQILVIFVKCWSVFFLNVIKNLSHFDQFVPSKFSINFSCVSLKIHQNQFRHKTTSISLFWSDVWCIRSSRAWSVHLWWFRGRERASPRVKRAEVGPASEASWIRWSIKRLQFHSFEVTFGASGAPGRGDADYDGLGAKFRKC